MCVVVLCVLFFVEESMPPHETRIEDEEETKTVRERREVEPLLSYVYGDVRLYSICREDSLTHRCVGQQRRCWCCCFFFVSLIRSLSVG